MIKISLSIKINQVVQYDIPICDTLCIQKKMIAGFAIIVFVVIVYICILRKSHNYHLPLIMNSYENNQPATTLNAQLDNSASKKENDEDKRPKTGKFDESRCAICSASPPVKNSYPPCGHTFCYQCLLQSLKVKMDCLTCQQKIPFFYSEDGNEITTTVPMSPSQENYEIVKRRLIELRTERDGHIALRARNLSTEEDENQIRNLTRSMLLWLSVYAEIGKKLRRAHQ